MRLSGRGYRDELLIERSRPGEVESPPPSVCPDAARSPNQECRIGGRDIGSHHRTGCQPKLRHFIFAVACLIISLPLVVVSAQARVLVLTFGGLLAFQSSAGLSLVKSIYFAVAVIALLSAIATFAKHPDHRALNLMKPMLYRQ